MRSNRAVRAVGVRLFPELPELKGRVVHYRRAQIVFSQGDAAASVMYLQKGRVTLSVLSKAGKEAVVALLRPGAFFGEGCLAGQSFRTRTATATAPGTVLVVEKATMIRLLHEQRALADRFITHMLARNSRIEHDLLDRLFGSSERRLARTLLLLAHYGTEDMPQRVLPKVSQETLAQMIGTTPSRVDTLMCKFQKQGYIRQNGRTHIDRSLLTVVLQD
jgi:CRP/FNR family transcriptional regulator, cyclic AMP receptor protein